MLDFSLSYEDMVKLAESCEDFLWIDHHKGVIDDPRFRTLKCISYLNTSVSACELAWIALISTEIPRFIKLLSLYDTWNHEDEEPWHKIESFQYGLKTQETDPNKNPELWRMFFKMYDNGELFSLGSIVDDCISGGSAIMNYIDLRNSKILEERSYFVAWEGYKCLVINSDASMANYMTKDKLFNSCDIAINYCSDKGKDWIVNLRSINPEIDLSTIAKRYGGGGHKSAAGFRTKKNLFEVK